jgi:hypothetical protein
MGLKKKMRRLFGIDDGKGRSEFYWESYNRTLFVADRIKSLGAGGGRLLDVGGTKRDNLFARFGIGEITTVNILKDADIVSSAHDLPLEDSSFDCVTCIDTLEHVPVEMRPKIIRELVRVASKAVFIVAPVDSPENVRAEELVLKHLSAQFIKEHRAFGLVDFGRVRDELESIRRTGVIERIDENDLDDLMAWVILILGDKVEPSRLYQELYFLENRFHPRRKAVSVYLSKNVPKPA